jgi:hypothetical protein
MQDKPEDAEKPDQTPELPSGKDIPSDGFAQSIKDKRKPSSFAENTANDVEAGLKNKLGWDR